MSWHEELKKMKAESGKTTEDIVAETKLSKGTLDKIFSGETKSPGIDKIAKLVQCLGYTLDDLYPDYPVSKGGGPLQDSLLHSFAQLNCEGQERLVETADDMVASGKYIKTRSAGLGKGAEMA